MTDNIEIKTKVRRAFLSNYFIWFIPSLLIMVLTVVAFVLVFGASIDFGSSSGKDPFRRWPKGLIGALGIQYLLAGIAVSFSFLFFDHIDVEGWIYIVITALVCFLLSYWGIQYDIKRLGNLLF